VDSTAALGGRSRWRDTTGLPSTNPYFIGLTLLITETIN